jgi:hypothetical protein
MDQLRTELIVGRLALCLAAALIVSACGGDAAPPEPYVGLHPTKEAAAQAVVDALATRDAGRLITLAVSAPEFRKNVWPSLPASNPEVGMPVDYVWSNTDLRSRGQLAETLETYGGAALVVESVRFAGDTTAYEGFLVHRDTWVTTRDGQGTRREVRLFGSMIETPAGWKVYSYVID